MKAIPISGALAAAIALVALAGAPPSSGGDQQPRTLGDHPAVIVQRLHKTAGYDYASKFYPHPAWLYLHAEPPRDGTEP